MVSGGGGGGGAVGGVDSALLIHSIKYEVISTSQTLDLFCIVGK